MSRSRPFSVERLESRELLATFQVTTLADSGAGSFREAITNANANAGADLIQFNVGTGSQTINLVTSLPPVTGPTVIDATTQPGFAGLPLIELNGAGAGTSVVGLTLSGGNSTVRGFILNRFSGSAVTIQTVGGNVIQGNYIGVNAAGTAASANAGGIFVNNVGGNTIGGTTPATRNVISGNLGVGINLFASNANNNVIQGNYIGVNAAGTAAIGNASNGIVINGGLNNIVGGLASGAGNVISGNLAGLLIQNTGVSNTLVQGNRIGTNAAGTAAVPNTFIGVTINGAGRNTVGGTSPGARNIISGNGRDGILIQGASADRNLVQGNYLGVAADGASPLGNASTGIVINGASNSVIGGTSPALNEGNIIAFNGSLFSDPGVMVLGGTSNQIVTNSIFSNVGLGIDLGTKGITPNDPGDADSGANNLQNFPIITLAQTGAGQTIVEGSLNSRPGRDFILQFFSNPAADPSGNGEGQTFIGAIAVTTDASGDATFRQIFQLGTTIGHVLTATATDLNGVDVVGFNTSEFSPARPIAQAPVTDLDVQVDVSPSTVLLQALATFTVTVTNAGPATASAVRLDDLLPANVTLISATPSQGVVSMTAGSLTTDFGAIAANGVATLTVVVRPTATGTIRYDSAVSGFDIDSDVTNNFANAIATVIPSSDVRVTVNSAPEPVPVGTLLTYTVIAVNEGPSTANNVVVSSILPAGVTFDSASSDQGSCSQANGIVTCNLGVLAPGGSNIITIRVRPNAVGSITLAANVSATEADPNPGNNIASRGSNVKEAADLAVTISASPNPVLIGNNLTYTINVTNNGPSPATSAVLTDVLPVGLNFVSTTDGSFNASNRTVTAALGTLAPNQTRTISIVVAPTISGMITNTATASNSNEVDPTPSNDSASTTITASPADLGLTMVASPEPGFIGQTLTYTLGVTNNGPATATNVTITDMLPAGLTFVSATPSQGSSSVSGGVVTVNLGTIASGGTASVNLQVLPTTSGTIINSATISATEFDPISVNNTASVGSTISPADVSVTVVSSATTARLDDLTVFTVTVRNNGPATATNVRVTDTISPGASISSAVPSQGTANVAGGTISANLGSIASGATATLIVTVSPTAIVTITSTTSVVANEFDPATSNNSANASFSVFNTPGDLQFSNATYSVNENGGSALITVVRRHGNQGTVGATFSTSNGTAVAGVNFTTTAGVLTFAPGETVKTFNVPVMVDGEVTDPLDVNLSLINPTGGAALGTPAAAKLNIQNVDVDLTSPTVVSVTPVTVGQTSLNIQFSERLDPTKAASAANYAIVLLGRDQARPGPDRQIPISGVSYNDATRTTTLSTTSTVLPNRFYQVVVNGAGITDRFNNVLDGDGDGKPGGNFIASVGQGNNLRYFDSGGDDVSLKITGPGSITINRNAQGEGTIAVINGVVTGRTTITGGVIKPKRGGNGLTTFKTINGFGVFGDVISLLTTPPFFVTNPAPVPPSTAQVALIQLAATKPKGPIARGRAR